MDCMKVEVFFTKVSEEMNCFESFFLENGRARGSNFLVQIVPII